MASITGVGDERRTWRAGAVPVTSAGDGFEHLVAEATMTPGNAGSYVAVCGRRMWAAALACPAGPRCSDCLAVTHADPAGRARHRRRDRSGVWARLTALLRHPRPARSESPDVTLPSSCVLPPQALRSDRP